MATQCSPFCEFQSIQLTYSPFATRARSPSNATVMSLLHASPDAMTQFLYLPAPLTIQSSTTSNMRPHTRVSPACRHGITALGSPRGNSDYVIGAPEHYPFAFSQNPTLQWVNGILIKGKPALHKRTFLKPPTNPQSSAVPVTRCICQRN